MESGQLAVQQLVSDGFCYIRANFSVRNHIRGAEPPQLHEFVVTHYYQMKIGRQRFWDNFDVSRSLYNRSLNNRSHNIRLLNITSLNLRSHIMKSPNMLKSDRCSSAGEWSTCCPAACQRWLSLQHRRFLSSEPHTQCRTTTTAWICCDALLSNEVWWTKVLSYEVSRSLYNRSLNNRSHNITVGF